MATVVPYTGLAICTNRLKSSGTEPNYVAWGTGAGTAAQSDTTLFTEASEARVAGTSTQQTTTQTNDTYQVLGTLTANGTKTITNAGLFDASASGNMALKGDFTGVVLALNDQIAFTMKIQFA